jgi:uroporphyrinogen-III synthase
LTAAGYRVTGRSLIEFEAVPFRIVPPADWIFFYSRRAVTFFFDQLPGPLEEVRLAALGAGTAETLRSYGYRPDFTGAGKPEAAARDFLPHATGQRVLFPRARHSVQSVQRALGDAVVGIDLVVYDNRPSSEVPSRDFDVLVFTSPMNARAFFQQRERRPGQRVIAIGRTTAAALHQLLIKEIEIAPEPSEEGMARVVIGGSKD